MDAPKNTLLTGFTAFRDVISNPTERLVRHFETVRVEGHALTTCVLPVSYRLAPSMLRERIESAAAAGRPFDLILMLGVATRTPYWRVERFGRNQNRAIPDADGFTPPYRIEETGPARLEATLPVSDIVSALARAGLPAQESRAAGAYLCNHVLYSALRHAQQCSLNVQIGFLHVPADPVTMAEGKSIAGAAPFDRHIEALHAALAALVGAGPRSCDTPDHSDAQRLSTGDSAGEPWSSP